MLQIRKENVRGKVTISCSCVSWPLNFPRRHIGSIYSSNHWRGQVWQEHMRCHQNGVEKVCCSSSLSWNSTQTQSVMYLRCSKIFSLLQIILVQYSYIFTLFVSLGLKKKQILTSFQIRRSMAGSRFAIAKAYFPFIVLFCWLRDNICSVDMTIVFYSRYALNLQVSIGQN